MMSKKTQAEIIQELQNDQDYIILNNPLAIPKFVRAVGKKETIVSEVYISKIFFEIVSQLTPQHLSSCVGDYVSINFEIGCFLNSIEAGNSNNDYNHVLYCIEQMQKIIVKFEDVKMRVSFSVIPYFKYEKGNGTILIDVRKEFAETILNVKQNENFSFLKKHLFRLQNAQAIKLFPYFVSWKNRGMVEINIENFKKKFGYDGTGYSRFKNLKVYVIEPAITEINEKTDLTITYKLLGDNLTGERPRVKGLQFFIAEKKPQKEAKSERKEKPLLEVEIVPVQEIIEPKVQIKNEYLDDIFRVFLIFEPNMTIENVTGFLSAFDNQRAVLEACLYAESEKKRGVAISNFRGFLVSGIPKKMGAGMLEVRAVEQEKQKKIEEKKQAEKDKLLQFQIFLNVAETIQKEYKSAINEIMRETATEKEKEIVADILRKQTPIYAKRTLDDFRKSMFVGAFMNKFIEIYPQRFEDIKKQYTAKYEKIMIEIKKFDNTKYRELFY